MEAIDNTSQLQQSPLDQVDAIGDVSTNVSDTASSLSNRSGSSIRETELQASLNDISSRDVSNSNRARSGRLRDRFDAVSNTDTPDDSQTQSRRNRARSIESPDSRNADNSQQRSRRLQNRLSNLEERFSSPEAREFINNFQNRLKQGGNFEDRFPDFLKDLRDRFGNPGRPGKPPKGGDPIGGTPPIDETPPERPPIGGNPPEEPAPPQPPIAGNPDQPGQPPIGENPAPSEPGQPPIGENPSEPGQPPTSEKPDPAQPEQPPIAENPDPTEPGQPPIGENPDQPEQPPVAGNPDPAQPEQPPVAENPNPPQPEQPPVEPPKAEKSNFHIDLSKVASQRTLNADQIGQVDVQQFVDGSSDILAPRGGVNTVIGSGADDVVLGNTPGAFNTITTGTGSDFIVLGDEATNRVFDFNPAEDKFVLTGDVSIDDLIIGQGTNVNRGGLQQPLDNIRHTLLIDKSTDHILASLQFTGSESITEANFARLDPEALSKLPEEFAPFVQDAARNQSDPPESNGRDSASPTPDAAGEHNHSAPTVPNAPTMSKAFNRLQAIVSGRDVLIGGDGDDFITPGSDAFKFNTAKGGGGTEFPFATNSPGTSEVKLGFADNVLTLDGTYKDFDGEPLFINGEREIAKEATNLSPTAESALLASFLAVDADSEGNARSGTHLHFSPAGDSRANAADATVVRFLNNTVNDDGKSGTFSGRFELSPEEQAALAAGNLYINIHTNQDGDGDGKGGFITGENRLNLNQNVVSLA